MSSALAGGDNDVGIEEFDIAHQLGDRPVFDDGVCAVLHVRVSEDPNAIRAELTAVAARPGRRSLDQPFIGDISIGPLIDPNELSADSARNGQRMQRRVREHIDPDGQSCRAPDTVGGGRHVGRGLWTDVLGFGKREVAMVLDDEAIDSGVSISLRIGESSIVDTFDTVAQ